MTREAAAWAVVLKNRGLISKMLRDNFAWLENGAKSPSMEYGDYYSAGLLGLYQAALKYDDRKKCKFSTYAFYWIRQSISRTFRISGFKAVRVPCHMFDRLAKLQKQHKDKFGPWLDNHGPKALVSAQNALSDCVYMDATFNGPEDRPHTYEEVVLVSNDDTKHAVRLHSDDVKIVLRKAITAIRNKERLVVRACFGMNRKKKEMTTAEVAQQLGVCEDDVKQIKSRALGKIRSWIHRHGIQEKELRS